VAAALSRVLLSSRERHATGVAGPAAWAHIAQKQRRPLHQIARRARHTWNVLATITALTLRFWDLLTTRRVMKWIARITERVAL
jgi:hypothetical protein